MINIAFLQKNKKIIFSIFSVLILTFSLFLNAFAKLSYRYDTNFDWWSDSIIYSDILYNNVYHPEQSNTIFFSSPAFPRANAALWATSNNDDKLLLFV